ncbi:MAG: NUDIX domain-containing protein [Rhizobiales bacterium]|nr:NUDIX domain-containing protein [Hyphomicrobiales bacterium]
MTVEGGQPGWPRVAASVAVFRSVSCREVLLVKRAAGPAAGLWSLPGGKIEPGEVARDAALRELAEETGVRARLCGLVDVAEVIRRGTDGGLLAHYAIVVFTGLLEWGEVRAGSDAAEAGWLDVGALDGVAATDGLAAIVSAAARRITKHR